MTEFLLSDFLDIEAIVDNEEEEEEDEQELAKFLDDDIEESELGREQPRSVTPSELSDKATDMLARTAARGANKAPRPKNNDRQHLLLPAKGDPEMWAPGFESRLIMQIATRCLTRNSSGQPTIVSAFTCPGILGYLFIEGQPCDVSAAVCGLVTVYGKPHLVPSDECLMLLSRCSPLHHCIHKGKRVRCLHRLYCGDMGLVCGHNHLEADVTIAFVPHIPKKALRSAKCKRPGCPELCKWTAAEVKAMWGKQRYKSGLIIKYLPPASIVIADPPLDISPFILTKYISNLPFFSSVGHQVKVVISEQQGLVGHTTDVCDGVVTVTLQVGEDISPLIISLHVLSIQYSPGGHIKHRFADSCSILSTVNKDRRAVTYIEKDTNEEYVAHMDTIELHSPSCNFFRFTPGLWVHFSSPRDSEQPKCRGYITAVEEDHALVTDELTFTEFKIDTQELEVSATQAASLPAGNLVHHLLGRRVIITQGECKGSKEEEIAKSNPGHCPRSFTPLPGPDCPPLQALMPEPEGSHWLFNPLIQQLMEQKTILFHLCDTHKSSDESLQRLERSSAGDNVVVIKGLLLGALGVFKAMGEGLCTVTFSLDNNPVDYQFKDTYADNAETLDSTNPQPMVINLGVTFSELKAVKSWDHNHMTMKPDKRVLLTSSLCMQRGHKSTQATRAGLTRLLFQVPVSEDRTEEVMEMYDFYSAAALSFSEDFQTCLEQKNLKIAFTRDKPRFNNDETGWMLIPIRDLKAYNKDPVGVQAKVNTGPRMAMQLTTNRDRPLCQSVSQLSGLKTVTASMMVYVAIVARHTLSTQNTWSSKDGTFDYQDFSSLLFQILDLNKEWTSQTIHFWNVKLFGNENGVGPDRETTSSSDSDDFLAMVKDQSEDHHAQKTLAEQPGEDPDPWGDGDLSDPPGNDDDPDTPPPYFKPEGEGLPPAIPPALKKCYRKQKDNGIGDQEEGQEADNKMQPRAAKQCKPANPELQAKPKAKAKLYSIVTNHSYHLREYKAAVYLQLVMTVKTNYNHDKVHREKPIP
ncbi:hypothetical protein V8E53_014181 [Lactarius tabidus]